MQYKHHFVGAQASDLPVGKIVCVGRNYAEHAKELNNPVPTEPLLFIKPSTALADLSAPVELAGDKGDVHYETELMVLIGAPLTQAKPEEAFDAIAGVGVALDLTLRDLQSKLKEKGLPWEKAKAFDASCPVSEWVPMTADVDLANLELKLIINDEVRQQGNTSHMLMSVPTLLSHISEWFTLLPGDIVLTGTPAGVGRLASGDRLQVSLSNLIQIETQVV